jgi:hypothetical protein
MTAKDDIADVAVGAPLGLLGLRHSRFALVSLDGTPHAALPKTKGDVKSGTRQRNYC